MVTTAWNAVINLCYVNVVMLNTTEQQLFVVVFFLPWHYLHSSLLDSEVNMASVLIAEIMACLGSIFPFQ